MLLREICWIVALQIKRNCNHKDSRSSHRGTYNNLVMKHNSKVHLSEVQLKPPFSSFFVLLRNMNKIKTKSSKKLKLSIELRGFSASSSSSQCILHITRSGPTHGYYKLTDYSTKLLLKEPVQQKQTALQYNAGALLTIALFRGFHMHI